MSFRLQKTKILAPASGTILEIDVIEGQVVVAAASFNAGTRVMAIADLSELMIDTHINQVDVAKVSVGQTATFTREALVGSSDQPMTAKIQFIAPIASVKNNIKGFSVEALVMNAMAGLRPGMTVNMKIPVAKAEDVVSVPVSAVFEDDDASRIVYVRQEEGPEKRKVEVGLTNLFYAEIKSGLEPGEEILLVKPEELTQS